MKKIMLLACAILTAAVFAGCCSVETTKTLNNQKLTTSGTTIAHMNVENSGIYLFSIPLLSGSVEHLGDITVLKDTVNAHSVIPVVASEAKKLGGNSVRDLTSQFSNPGFILYFPSFKASANVVK